MKDVKGGVGVLLMHCEFNELEGSITHYMHEFDSKMYESLMNLYAVCIAVTNNKKKIIRAGFFIKTSFHHSDDGFVDNLKLAMKSTPKLQKYLSENSSLFPARIGVNGPPPTEQEMLSLMMQQYTKYSVEGSC